ncbi:hypothetical protein C2869_12895 [Saccharobesus litoralis]|uniref:Uncharacterized protein n=1 Tax=Saccharobesus litoralis TaxID=2172099 RepID=A0A2S0VSX7_9ALTE|nr:hypothetical protein [Saccharobesus litoralis]AWB67282.1 hypothetical protein C2869_12895 [Saccharobesus litoralis]
MYITLDFDKLVETIQQLHQRIDERFPCSRLKTIAKELNEMADKSSADIEWINRPNIWLRLGAALVVLMGVSFMVYSWMQLDAAKTNTLNQVTFVQISESVFNNVILGGAAIFFLFSIENRIKRSRLISSLHHLREIAHVIDMLQLTKDPYYASGQGTSTESSPERTMTVFELQRYLDYCSEMLSLVGKLAALYVKHFPDPSVTQAVNEVEVLCTNLSRKIWQKIIIANSLEQKALAAAEVDNCDTP